MIDVQALTLAEAIALLLFNAVGLALTFLAWRVSDLDVAEVYAWEPPVDAETTRLALRHNRLLVTKDARHGEARRFQAHALIALIGLFWILTPQPTNPAVVWWAVAIRSIAIALSVLLIDKTLHHLVARYRFDRPWTSDSLAGNLGAALAMARREVASGSRRPPPAAVRPQDLGLGRMYRRSTEIMIAARLAEHSRPKAGAVAPAAATIVLWNRAAEDALGWAEAEIVGRPLLTIIPERHREKHLDGVRRYLEGGGSELVDRPVVIDVPGLHKDGHEVDLEIKLQRADATIRGVYAIAVARTADHA